jgi:hypothetical protein
VVSFERPSLKERCGNFKQNPAHPVELSIKICRDPGSNRVPLDLQSNALPTELSRLRSQLLVNSYPSVKIKGKVHLLELSGMREKVESMCIARNEA